MPTSGDGTQMNKLLLSSGSVRLTCPTLVTDRMKMCRGPNKVGLGGIYKMPSTTERGNSSGKRASARKEEVDVKVSVNAKPRRSRRERREAKAKAAGTENIQQSDLGKPPSRSVDGLSNRSRIQKLLFAPCLSEDGEAWVRYHADPAGYHETGGKKPRMVYIPDGALAKGVGGEVRQIDIINCPLVQPSAIPLDGTQWSLYLLSFGTFRLNFIALASINNDEATGVVLSALTASINDFTYAPNENAFNFMKVHDALGENLEGWYWKPVFNKQTSALPEPQNGVSTTLDRWRTVGSSLTAAYNAASLLNQGYAAGGQFAREVQVENIEQSLESMRLLVLAGSNPSSSTGVFTVYGPGLVLLPGENIEGEANDPPVPWTVPQIGETSVRVARANIAYLGESFAKLGERVQLARSGTSPAVSLDFTNLDDPLSTPIHIVLNTAGMAPGSVQQFYLQAAEFAGELKTQRNILVLPPMTLSDIVSNDPDCEAAILKRSGGIYGVHVKTGAPVFSFASATTFGPLNFATPGYNVPAGGTAGGIRDTVDPNIGTISMCFMGLATSTNVVTKRFFTWEGMPSEGSTAGQFAATGGECDETALIFIDNFSGTHNSIYAAKDNFFGAIANALKGLLGSVMSHEATPAVISGVAGIAKDTLGSFLMGRR